MPEPSLRADLPSLSVPPAGANAGLWLDRFLPTQLGEDETPGKGQEHPHTAQIRTAAAIGVPTAYARFFTRWHTALAALPQPEGYKLRTGEAVARGRVVVGLGAEGVLENAITLHRAYGVPIIPGSALKGLVAAYAHGRLADKGWRKPPLELDPQAPMSAHEILFGSTRRAGYVTFFDALYVQCNVSAARPLLPDVLTVHHPTYYQGGEKAEVPADWDSPTPIAFISATGRFLVALAGPTQWVDTAYDILALALDEVGVGGKTAAGYGRFTLDGLTTIRARFIGPAALPPSVPPDSVQGDLGITHSDAATTGSRPATTAVASTRSIPSIGAVFPGKLIERGDHKILISVPGHPPEAVLATLMIGDDTPGWRVGDLARVEVISLEARAGRTILGVRRAPKAKKS